MAEVLHTGSTIAAYLVGPVATAGSIRVTVAKESSELSEPAPAGSFCGHMNRTSNISEIALFGPEGSPMQPGPGKRRRWPWLVGGAVFVLLAGVAAGKVASNGHANKAEQAPPSAEVVAVT